MTTITRWWQRGVVYQIYPRSFMDSNSDGIGDLPGVLAKLDYLQWLEIDAIWFSPTFPSPMADFGYDVADYVDIHPDFGTMADFDRLLAAANERGIRLILDLVPNHTSDQHAWFEESRSSRDNPKRDWYLWRDPAPDGGPPNNWLSVFGGSAWEYDDLTGQYYLHNFVKEQPDLNWRNPAVKAAMYDAIRFWLDRGVSGFRIDVIDFMYKDPEFRDDPPNPDYDPDHDIDTLALQKVNSAYRDEVHGLIKEMRAVFDEYQDRVSIGEVSYSLSPEGLAAYYGDEDELHLPFHFRLQALSLPDALAPSLPGQTWSAGNARVLIEAYERALPAFSWPNTVFGNHDMPRLASNFGPAARVAGMLLLTLRGTPFIYYGEEIGLENVPIPHEEMQDPFGINYPNQSRDPFRTPMQWDASKHAGFTSGQPWLPVAADYKTRNVTVQQADPTSILNMYRRLLIYRRAAPALHSGRIRLLDFDAEDCLVYLREHEGERRLIALNFSGDAKTLDVARMIDIAEGRIALSTLLDREVAVDLAALDLRPYEGCVIEL